MFISVKSLSEIKGDATHIVSGWNDKKEFIRYFAIPKGLQKNKFIEKIKCLNCENINL